MEKESEKRMSEIEGKRNSPRWPRLVGTESYGERIREKNVRNRR